MKVEKIKPAETLIDGDVPGLRVRKTAGGLSWGLSVRVKGARRWIAVGVGIGLAETRQRARKLRQAIADGRDPAQERAEAKQRVKDARKGLGTLEAVMEQWASLSRSIQGLSMCAGRPTRSTQAASPWQK
jgi:Arm DNA-binding domain